jgi:general secretion pathway protein I
MRATRARQRGFTLIEVMFALALLGLALVVLIKSAAGSVFNAEQAHMLGIATDLGRGEMNEIEETLLKDGFQDTDQLQDWKGFDDLGWPNIKFSYKIEVVEMPTFDQLTAMANGSAGHGSGSAAAYGSAYGSSYGSGFGSGFGSSNFSISNGTVDPLATFQNSALGGMMTMMGGLSGGSDIAGAGAGALIQSQYSMFQEILKDSVRKVTLHLKWQVLGSDRDMTFVAFYTDASAMDRTLNGLGAADSGSGSGTGSGSGRGSGSGGVRTHNGSGSGS